MQLLKIFMFVAMLGITSYANALDIEIRKGKVINLSRPAAHVFIADPSVADIDVRSQNYIYVYGVAVGETTIHALDENNKTILSTSISVTPNFGNFKKTAKSLIPDSTLSLEAAGSNIILKGTVNTPEDAANAVNLAGGYLGEGQNLLNMMKVRGSDQVMLRVKISEVSRSAVKNFGINLSTMLSGDIGFGLVSGRNFLDTTGALVTDGNAIRLTDNTGGFTLDGVIDALETEGLVKTLAEPNLTAKSGESASFTAGGEFPVPVPQEDGVITIEYRDFGVSLDFTPTVLSDDRISLQVAPEVSSLVASAVTIQNNVIPTLSIRNASTTVELGSGESFAIAGLIQNDVSNNINKFPWLGDLPILGSLFRSNTFQRDETELVIIVTPYVVKGVKGSDSLLTPTEGYEVPNDFERILLGKLYNRKEKSGRPEGSYEGKIATRRLHGNPGYILEDK